MGSTLRGCHRCSSQIKNLFDSANPILMERKRKRMRLTVSDVQVHPFRSQYCPWLLAQQLSSCHKIAWLVGRRSCRNKRHTLSFFLFWPCQLPLPSVFPLQPAVVFLYSPCHLCRCC